MSIVSERPGVGEFWASLDGRQRRSLAMMATVVVALHVIGFVTLFAVVAPNRYATRRLTAMPRFWVFQPAASVWISEAVQAEFTGTDAAPQVAPTQLAQPAGETRATRAN